MPFAAKDVDLGRQRIIFGNNGRLKIINELPKNGDASAQADGEMAEGDKAGKLFCAVPEPHMPENTYKMGMDAAAARGFLPLSVRETYFRFQKCPIVAYVAPAVWRVGRNRTELVSKSALNKPSPRTGQAAFFLRLKLRSA